MNAATTAIPEPEHSRRDIVITGLSRYMYELQLVPVSLHEAELIAASMLDKAINEALMNAPTTQSNSTKENV